MTSLTYRSKRTLLAPRVAYMRARHRDLDPLSRQLLETHGYARSMFDFMAAAGANPGMLTEASIGPGGVAVDIGAYRGDWTAEMIDRHGCTVYAFEPNPAPKKVLDARFEDVDNVMVLGYGLAAADRTAMLTKDGPGSTMYRSRGAFGEVDVPIRDVVGAFRELSLERIDVMKVNVEGAEYDLLPRLADVDWFRRIGTLFIQFHEWIPRAHRRRDQIHKQLRASHELLWCYPWVWECWQPRKRSVT